MLFKKILIIISLIIIVVCMITLGLSIYIVIYQFDQHFSDPENRDFYISIFLFTEFFFVILSAILIKLYFNLNKQKLILEKTERLPLASYRSRIISSLIDSSIYLIIYFSADLINSWTIVNFSFYYLSAYLFVLYELFFNAYNGQTIGKMIMRIKIFKNNGLDINIREILLRSLFGISILIIALFEFFTNLPRLTDEFFIHQNYNDLYMEYLKFSNTSQYLIYLSMLFGSLEILTMYYNNERRSIHDLIAGTIVLRK